jgi:poly(3-hydroxybutyrate) depolymerase
MRDQQIALRRYGGSLPQPMPVVIDLYGADPSTVVARVTRVRTDVTKIVDRNILVVAPDAFDETLGRHLQDRAAGHVPLPTTKPAPTPEAKSVPRLVSISGADATRRLISGLA